MIVLLALYFCHTVTFVGAAEDFNPLGMGIYLPEFNLQGILSNTGIQILNPSALQQCTKHSKKDDSSREFNYYKDTKSFYSSVATAAGLQGSLKKSKFSLGFTLDRTSKNIGGTKRTVTGSSLLILASHREDTVDKSCLLERKYFDETFLNNFGRLPTRIHEPWKPNSWIPYQLFLKAYGSHVCDFHVSGFKHQPNGICADLRFLQRERFSRFEVAFL
ncbi:hypothetical protein OS493_026386 [Desmophyllum pertusum]|uniref:Uncharacterized protein n=1 Tax=Desmophyllum pertusum TaxID=174260 RepID=A0A9X0CY80_9CNID|nr:hypothetical protein OS493_026386 [Desmophyllum pertusum]